jgi:hypothetical protein
LITSSFSLLFFNFLIGFGIKFCRVFFAGFSFSFGKVVMMRAEGLEAEKMIAGWMGGEREGESRRGVPSAEWRRRMQPLAGRD